MRGFLAMGGGVGLGALGVTHGLGPEPATPPPPPPPPIAPSSNSDEREEIWDQKRMTMRQWDAQQQRWRLQSQFQEQVNRQYERIQAELRTQQENAARAHAEQQRLRAADLLYRYRPAEDTHRPAYEQQLHEQRLREQQQQLHEQRARAEYEQLIAMIEQMSGGASDPSQWSTSGASQVDGVHSVNDVPFEHVETVDGIGVEPTTPADFAIVPLGDHAPIAALAEGTLEILVDPVKGIRAVLETDQGQQFMYAGIGSIPKRRVRAGETIGFTPAANPHAAASSNADATPSIAASMPSTGELPPSSPATPWPAMPWPAMPWPAMPWSAMPWPAMSSVEATASQAPRDNVIPFSRPPPPTNPPSYLWRTPPRRPRRPARKAVGILVLLGIGVAMVASSKRR